MKNRNWFMLLPIVLSTTGNAQSNSLRKVGDAVEELRQAMVNADSSGLAKLTMDQLSYGHSSGHVEGKKEFIEKIITGKSDFVNINLTDQTISVSGNTAIVRHLLNAKTNDNGKPGEVHLYALLVWQLQNGKWKLLARQAVKLGTDKEKPETNSLGTGKTVLLDRYFNSEKKKDSTGNAVYWHYTWEEKSNGGFSLFGTIFQKYGAKLAVEDGKPTKASLQNAAIYIIVDPDHLKDNPAPNYVSPEDITLISDWVRSGGVLLLMANDSANCELTHFNQLAGVFGINFTDKSSNMVKGDEFETGAVEVKGNHPIFAERKMYLKDISVLSVKAPAQVTVSKGGDAIMAVAAYGKGVVFAVGDPWVYNEYLDGARLPAAYDNYGAADDLVRWLLKQTKN